jgi:hypothetical protein
MYVFLPPALGDESADALHAAFTWFQAPAAVKILAACSSFSETSEGIAIQPYATRCFALQLSRNSV